MSDSIFFDSAKLFHKPGSLDYALMLLWLFGLWVVAISYKRKGENHNIRVRTFNIADFCILGLVLISVINLIIVLLDYSIWDQVFQEFVTLISLFAGYYIIKDWFSRKDPEIVVKFLFTLVVVNSIASVLYFLNQGLHVHIYLDETAQEETFNGEVINRAFYFMPQFIFLSIAFCLVFRKRYPVVSWTLIGVNLLAVFVSFTRSFLILTVLLFLLYFVFVGLKKRQLSSIFKNIFVYSIPAVLAVLIIAKVFPNKAKYFQDRFTELTKKSSSIDGPNNLEYRFMNTRDVVSKISDNKEMLGMGPLSEMQSSKIGEMKRATSDMAWAGVIFRWGFIGLFLFALLYIFSFFSAFKLFLNSEGVISDLSILLLLFIISQMIESFVSWTFMSGHGLTTGLWYFALLSAILKYNKTPYFVNQNKMDYIEQF